MGGDAIQDLQRIDLSNPEQLTRLCKLFRVTEADLIALSPRFGFSTDGVREHLGCWDFSRMREPRETFAPKAHARDTLPPVMQLADAGDDPSAS